MSTDTGPEPTGTEPTDTATNIVIPPGAPAAGGCRCDNTRATASWWAAAALPLGWARRRRALNPRAA